MSGRKPAKAERKTPRDDRAEHLPLCIGVSDMLARLGDKWNMLLVLLLRGETKRFGELKRLVPGISQRMLTRTLRHLERDGLVKRTYHPTVPPRVDYELTPLGRSLSAHIDALGAWARAHEAEIRSARQDFDAQDRDETSME
ncbi:MAG: helix-turn-helix domain-containing protein [Polyangiales bacterium]